MATTDHHTSDYAGGQTVLGFHLPKNDVQAGIYAFRANDSQFFGLISNNESGNPPISETDNVPGSEEAVYLSDRFSVTSWLTLIGGVRATHFSSVITEGATYPRIGGTLRIPHVNWVFRAFWGRFYQPPPLSQYLTIGPLLRLSSPPYRLLTHPTSFDLTCAAGAIRNLSGFSVTIPIRGWSLDIDNFETRGINFLDHNNIGESDILYPGERWLDHGFAARKLRFALRDFGIGVRYISLTRIRWRRARALSQEA